MSALSSPLHPRSDYSAFTTPLAVRSVNLQSRSSPYMSTKLSQSSPIRPISALDDQQQERIFFDTNDLQLSKRRTNPRIPDRRFRSPNPLTKSSDKRQQERRERFLKDVQEKREEGRWSLRSDQILRQDWLKQQNEWEAAHAREAPDAMSDVDEEHEPHSSLWATTYQPYLQDLTRIGPTRLNDKHEPKVLPNKTNCTRDISQPEQDPLHPKQIQDYSNDMDHSIDVDAMAQAEAEEVEALVAMHEEQSPDSPMYEIDDDDFDPIITGLQGMDGSRSDDVDMS